MLKKSHDVLLYGPPTHADTHPLVSICKHFDWYHLHEFDQALRAPHMSNPSTILGMAASTIPFSPFCSLKYAELRDACLASLVRFWLHQSRHCACNSGSRLDHCFMTDKVTVTVTVVFIRQLVTNPILGLDFFVPRSVPQCVQHVIILLIKDTCMESTRLECSRVT